MQTFYRRQLEGMGNLFSNAKLTLSLLLFAFSLMPSMVNAQCVVEGGVIYTEDPTTICANDGEADPIDVTVMNSSGQNAAWIITDDAGNILAIPPAPPFDLNGAGAGLCLIWYMRYEDGLTGLATGNNISALNGCYDLSNEIAVDRMTRRGCTDLCEASPAYITTNDPTEICAGDGVGDPITVDVFGGYGDDAAWIITDDLGNILALPPSPPFDLDGAGGGVCEIWYMTNIGDVDNLATAYNLSDLEGCYALSNPITVVRNGVDGGVISTNDPTAICAGDGVGDPIDVDVEGAQGSNAAWLITDEAGNILALPPSPPFDLDGAGPGVCLIWYLRYEDGLTGLAAGNNAADLDGCFDLSNAIAVTRNGVDGGVISTNDPTTICANDGEPDPVHVHVSGSSGSNAAWVITDDLGNILALPAAPPFDLSPAGPGVCLIWYLGYEDGLTGLATGNNTADLAGCYDFSNPIEVIRLVGRDCFCTANGGFISTDDPTEICAGDGIGDPIYVDVAAATGPNTAWIIADDAGNILALPSAPPFDLEGAGPGLCLIYHVSYNDDVTGITTGNTISDIEGCFDLSDPIAVTRNGVDGGMISTNDPTEICTGDGVGDPIDITVSGSYGANGGWIITDDMGTILALPSAPPFDLEGAGAGVCLIWYIRYEDGLMGLSTGNNAFDLEGCFDLSNAIAVTRNGVDGGVISTNDPTTICANDGEADPIHVNVSGSSGSNTAWVITDDLGNILALPVAPPFDLSPAGPGVCLIWYLGYEDGLTGLATGNNTADLDGCFDLSNAITVTRLTGDDCEGSGGSIDDRGRGLAERTSSIGPSLEIFPNPVYNQININYQLTTNEGILSIYSANGRVLFEQTLSDSFDSLNIDLASYPTGYYFVRFKDGVNVVTKRIVKIEK